MQWTEQKSQRFQALRHEQERRDPSATEHAELDALLADLDADEADALRPSMERMQAEADAMEADTAKLDAQARALARIADEEEQLLADAGAYLERLKQRSAALADEFRRVTGRQLSHSR